LVKITEILSVAAGGLIEGLSDKGGSGEIRWLRKGESARIGFDPFCQLGEGARRIADFGGVVL
jgi:hypothetical protein